MKSQSISPGRLIRPRTDLRRSAPVRLLALMFCIAMLPVASKAQQPPEHSHRRQYQKQVEALEQEWRDAELHGDVATIDRLLADDYIGINSNGILQTKDQTLARLRSGAVVFKRLDLTEVKVNVHGETAVVTSRAEVDSTQNGLERDGIYRYTRVYQHRGGIWKVVNFEATRINPNAARNAPDTEPDSSSEEAPANTQSH